MFCGLAELDDGNVLSLSHEEMQLLKKTGSAMTVNACVSECVCLGRVYPSLVNLMEIKSSLSGSVYVTLAQINYLHPSTSAPLMDKILIKLGVLKKQSMVCKT